jgi:hypothetical protein
MMQTNLPVTADAQKQFDAKYISASEIMRELNIARSVLMYGRNHGKLPTPHVSLNDGTVLLWDREIVRPYIERWKESLKSRRGQN